MAHSGEVLSHWHHSTESLSVSPSEFYDMVKVELERNDAPVKFDRVEWSEGSFLSARRTYLRIEFNRLVFDVCAAPFGTSAFFSWWLTKRASDLAAMYGCIGVILLPFALALFIAVFGIVKGFLFFLVALGVSGLLLRSAIERGSLAIEDSILAMPGVGLIYAKYFRPVTYYSVDSQMMFQDAVHGTVVKVVEALLSAKGARALTPEQMKPSTREVLR